MVKAPQNTGESTGKRASLVEKFLEMKIEPEIREISRFIEVLLSSATQFVITVDVRVQLESLRTRARYIRYNLYQYHLLSSRRVAVARSTSLRPCRIVPYLSDGRLRLLAGQVDFSLLAIVRAVVPRRGPFQA